MASRGSKAARDYDRYSGELGAYLAGVSELSPEEAEALTARGDRAWAEMTGAERRVRLDLSSFLEAHDDE
jgi:hypothetical protein